MRNFRHLSAWHTRQLPKPSPYTPIGEPGLIGWYDASDIGTLTIDNGEVSQVANKAGGLPVVASPGGGPLYAASEPRANDHPALVWPDDANEQGLELGIDAACCEVFVVMAYYDPLDITFDNWITLVADLEGISGEGVRMVGESAQSTVWARDANLAKVRVNGGAATDVLLPLPLSVVRFSSQDHPTPGTPFNIATIGGPNKGQPGRAWRGVICELLAFSAAASFSELQASRIISYLTAKWGL